MLGLSEKKRTPSLLGIAWTGTKIAGRGLHFMASEGGNAIIAGLFVCAVIAHNPACVVFPTPNLLCKMPPDTAPKP